MGLGEVRRFNCNLKSFPDCVRNGGRVAWLFEFQYDAKRFCQRRCDARQTLLFRTHTRKQLGS